MPVEVRERPPFLSAEMTPQPKGEGFKWCQNVKHVTKMTSKCLLPQGTQSRACFLSFLGRQRKASIEISTANFSAMAYQIGMQFESSKYSFETNSVLQFLSTDTQQEALWKSYESSCAVCRTWRHRNRRNRVCLLLLDNKNLLDSGRLGVDNPRLSGADYAQAPDEAKHVLLRPHPQNIVKAESRTRGDSTPHQTKNIKHKMFTST